RRYATKGSFCTKGIKPDHTNNTSFPLTSPLLRGPVPVYRQPFLAVLQQLSAAKCGTPPPVPKAFEILLSSERDSVWASTVIRIAQRDFP
ncbi:MAG: hypothetical protein ABSG53_25835, partial [Thermoguttaceae bacterium]